MDGLIEPIFDKIPYNYEAFISGMFIYKFITIGLTYTGLFSFTDVPKPKPKGPSRFEWFRKNYQPTEEEIALANGTPYFRNADQSTNEISGTSDFRNENQSNDEINGSPFFRDVNLNESNDETPKIGTIALPETLNSHYPQIGENPFRRIKVREYNNTASEIHIENWNDMIS
jgi:hypothetical protein